MNVTFKKLILLSVLTVLTGVGIVYALGHEFKPQGSTQTIPTAEGVNDQFGLKLTMTLQKTVYNLGEPINISLTLNNIGNQTINCTYGALGWRFDFRVYNGTNDGIYHWSSGRPFAWELDPITLNSGESLTNGQLAGAYVWHQTRNNGPDPIPLSLSPDPIQVDPGTYYIVGQTGPMLAVNGNERAGLIIETTPIQVTIVKQ